MEVIKNKIPETKKSQLSRLQAKHFEEKPSFIKISQNNGDTDLLTDDQNPSLNNISFNEFTLPTSPFQIKKFSNGIIEIINGDNHIQINAKNGPDSLGEEIYKQIINSQNVDDLLKDEEFQNGLKDVLRDPKAYSCSYYRDKDKNTDINVNFGLLQNDIKNQDDFEKLIYQQGVKSEFFVKVDESYNAEKYVKFSLYWDKKANKPAIHLDKSLNGDNIMLYGSNQELCGSVAKNNAKLFEGIKVSFQLYYNRGKSTFHNDDINKSLCFINETSIGDFFNSSQVSDLELNSSIVTTAQATKEITAKKREFTEEEKQEIIKKIDSHLESKLKEIFVKPADQAEEEYDNNIKLITAYLKNQNEQGLNFNNTGSTQQQSQELTKIKAINELKKKYQEALKTINPNCSTQPANIINNQRIGPQNQQQNQQQL